MLHGRALASVVRHLQPGARVLALSWDGSTPGKLAQLLRDRGLGDTRLTILENMGGPGERVQHTTAKAGVAGDVAALNTIALEVVAGAGSRISTLAPGPTTHRSRTTASSPSVRCAPSPSPRWSRATGSCCGTSASAPARSPSNGCCAIRRCAPSASRRDAARADIAARNAASLGTPELQIVHGRAPEALQGLPAPDAVFIGGGLGDGVLEPAWAALKPGGRIVANAVTLEAESALLIAFQQLGGELSRIDVARADSIGGLHGWRPAMPDHPVAGGEAMMVAGLGCRTGATIEAVMAAIMAALERCSLTRSQIDALATAIDKSAESGIAGAARSLDVRLIFVSPADMRATTAATLTSSARVESLKGVPSVAETAALAAAGRGARLLAPRIATATVTCAIAVGVAP